MTAPRDYLERALSPNVDKPALLKVLSYAKGPGHPEQTGTKPEFVGQEYLDTASRTFFKATGLDVEDWRPITA